MKPIQGILHLQYFYDVGTEIDLDLLKLPPPSLASPIQFESPPLEESLPPITLPSGDSVTAHLRYFSYGVVCLEFHLPFAGPWDALVALAAQWVGSDTADSTADHTLQSRLAHLAPAIKKPAEKLLREDYTIIELHQALDSQGLPLSAADLLALHGPAIVQIVRGERIPLSPTEQAEVLASSMSYMPGDLLVVGYAAALVYDQQPNGGLPVLQLLAYANTPLLESRVYDYLLAPVLADVSHRLTARNRFWNHWRGGREAAKLSAVQLEVMELTEKTDNAIKFLSDMFYSRAYKLASTRIGVPDYRRLVEAKLRVAGELYQFMTDRSHQTSAFVLELIVVIILIIDLTVLFTRR